MFSPVTFEIEDTHDGFGSVASLMGKKIGFLYLKVHEGEAFVWVAKVENDWKHTGLGQDLYDDVIREARARGLKTFVSKSESFRTDDGEKAWKRLEKRYNVSKYGTKYMIDLTQVI